MLKNRSSRYGIATSFYFAFFFNCVNYTVAGPRFFLINMQVDIAIPEVFVGGLLGSMLIFLFSAWACAAVGRTAQEVVNEVRRQFIERPGIMVSRIIFQKAALCCRILMERLKLMRVTLPMAGI